jgi:KaiC/GvpD/RAD55 family RecA-like ATPase
MDFIMRNDSERVTTGIHGLDNLIQGGLVKGSSVLVSGHAGCGKTIFCLQYLWDGLENGEPGAYMTLEETADEIKKDALMFGWDFEKYEKSGKFKIIEKNLFENPDLEFFELDKIKAKRLVIDSISLISLMSSDPAALRNRLSNMIADLKKKGVTVLMISEGGEVSDYSRSGVEEYLADAVIHLDFTPIGAQAGRSLFVRKMRRTKHSENIHPIEISKTGIKVLAI